jgi:alpha-tubulin suppressor-like RCC1 family protein
MKNLSWFILLFVLVGVLGACGSPASTVTGIAITFSPSSETLEAGGTVTLTAKVSGTGAFNNAVTWSVVSGAGTLSNITDSSVVLTAPNLGASSVVQVRAVSVQDSSKTKDITFRVSPNGGTVSDVAIVASVVALREGDSSELQGIVNGSGAINTNLNWTIDSGGVGTLSSPTGVKVTYTAPTTSFGKVVRITASSVQDSSKRKTIFVSVNPIKASIAAGVGHSLALKTDGTLLSWGANNQGQLGDSTSTTRATPVSVANALDIVAIAAGTGFSLALKSDGKLLAWGDDGDGQLGDNTEFSSKSSPTNVAVATDIIAIAAGAEFSLALKSDGTVLSWGDNLSGQLGDSADELRQPQPVLVTNATDVIAIAAGALHSLALKADGTVLSWGSDTFGQLGNDSTLKAQLAPVSVLNASNIVAIAAGSGHSLALKADGTLLSWGSDNNGQLGNNDSLTNNPTPVSVSSAKDIIAIAAGTSHSLALKADGTLLSWGSDTAGELGNNDELSNSPIAVPVADAMNIVAIAAGSHSLALKADGTLLSWGSNLDGQLGANLALNTKKPTPVSVLLGTFKIRVP